MFMCDSDIVSDYKDPKLNEQANITSYSLSKRNQGVVSTGRINRIKDLLICLKNEAKDITTKFQAKQKEVNKSPLKNEASSSQ